MNNFPMTSRISRVTLPTLAAQLEVFVTKEVMDPDIQPRHAFMLLERFKTRVITDDIDASSKILARMPETCGQYKIIEEHLSLCRMKTRNLRKDFRKDVLVQKFHRRMVVIDLLQLHDRIRSNIALYKGAN
jgi:hypothetical protein